MNGVYSTRHIDEWEMGVYSMRIIAQFSSAKHYIQLEINHDSLHNESFIKRNP